jgi:recombination protein RecR
VDYPSRLIENAVNQIAKLPGIGKKTALRLALHLIRDKEENTLALTEALNNLRAKIKFCATCHNISDEDVCSICTSHKRDKAILCVVEDAKDVMAIENTSQFNGVYHVLGGVISQ